MQVDHRFVHGPTHQPGQDVRVEHVGGSGRHDKVGIVDTVGIEQVLVQMSACRPHVRATQVDCNDGVDVLLAGFYHLVERLTAARIAQPLGVQTTGHTIVARPLCGNLRTRILVVASEQRLFLILSVACLPDTNPLHVARRLSIAVRFSVAIVLLPTAATFFVCQYARRDL